MKHFAYVLYMRFHALRNLCDKQNVLFYGHPRIKSSQLNCYNIKDANVMSPYNTASPITYHQGLRAKRYVFFKNFWDQFFVSYHCDLE